MSEKRKLDWKPVAIPKSALSNGIEGLICLQELCDYSIEKGVCNLVPPKKKCKLMKKETSQNGRLVDSENVTNGVGAWVVTPIKSQSELNGPQLPKGRNKRRKSLKKSTLKCNVGNVDLKGNTRKRLRKGSSDLDNVVLSDVPKGMEAWSCFKLPDPILRALSDLGFLKPTAIQEQTLPAAILGRRDILGAAETGSGKTLAFGIPIIYGILQLKKDEKRKLKDMDEEIAHESETNKLVPLRLNNVESDSIDLDSFGVTRLDKEKKLYALILTPTRELAIQVKDHLVAIAKYTNIQIAAVVGGLASQKQGRILKKRPEIIVATPGRLWDMIESGDPHLEQVDNISFLAVDETDRMLEKGYFQELQILLDRINQNESKKSKRQNFVFSATLTMVHEPSEHHHKNPKQSTLDDKLKWIMCSVGITNPKVVDINQEKGIASTLKEARIVCLLTEKDYYLYYLLLYYSGRTLVFCNSITCVQRLTKILEILEYKPYSIHANMQQRQRLKNLERFCNNPSGILLATDVAARGLDIPNVQHVVHYQVPRTTEGYVHRSGRTARAHKEGITILLMEPREVTLYMSLCRNLGRENDVPDFPIDESKFSIVRERVSLALKIDELQHSLRDESFIQGWFKKAAREVDILLDEDDLPHKTSGDASINIQKKLKGLRRQLGTILHISSAYNFLNKLSSENITNTNQSNAVAIVSNNKKLGSKIKLVK